ncbi:MAG: hypothetical protein H0W64_03660 [Gammaproteobacteria bacterium]|nr:hypothetical protein [Gammaproteobacteria bacterium]
MSAPVVIQAIPPQLVNELAAYGPFDLKNYIQAENSRCRFSAELKNGQPLPRGMICTEDGILTGIPAKGTEGRHEVILTIENEAGHIQTALILTIKSAPSTDEKYFDDLKSQVWEALDQNLPIPDLGGLIERAITPQEIYYLLERFGLIMIWDAFNLESPGDKHPLMLKDASPHYDVYDRGSCLVATPKDLYSHERTSLDGMLTARAMAREVYKRGWAIEMAGVDRFTKAIWVELQHLSDQYGRKAEIVNYKPTPLLVGLYTEQAINLGPRKEME